MDYELEDYVTFKQAKKLEEKGYPQKYNKEEVILPTGTYYFTGTHQYTDKNDNNVSVSMQDSFISQDDWIESFGYEDHEYYGTALECPTLYLVQKWLRKEKKIQVDVNICPNGEYECNIMSYSSYYHEWVNPISIPSFNSYEEALSYGITVAIFQFLI